MKRYDVVTGAKVEIVRMTGTSISEAQVSANGQWLLFVAHVSGQVKLQLIRWKSPGLVGKRLVIRQKICYHTRVKSEGESGVSRHSPDPHNQRGPAWSASNTYQYTENAWGKQPPAVGMLLPITFHCWRGVEGSRGRKGARE
ncbi:MAG: hypothetical protein AUI01_07475 [Ktedonobacter sp. 13_2_20CM_2_56_8]|nr:MAG: hypothetical protein AUI01_07475 [Ktedonobacter sp. 13_2_20CM_2_56_8]